MTTRMKVISPGHPWFGKTVVPTGGNPSETSAEIDRIEVKLETDEAPETAGMICLMHKDDLQDDTN